jgi:hypothetical protein
LAKGIVQLAGDFAGTAAAPVVKTHSISYSKMQLCGAFSVLGNFLSTNTEVTELSLGTLLFSGTTINSPFSFYGGDNPNITSPFDRPSSAQTVYVGTDNKQWTWNNVGMYIPTSKVNLLATVKFPKEVNVTINDPIPFTTLSIDRESKQGVTMHDDNGTTFVMEHASTAAEKAFVKMTVGIPNLKSPDSAVDIFTFDHSVGSYTGPGMTLTTVYNTNSSSHSYSEIFVLDPGSGKKINIQVKDVISPTSYVTIGDNGSTLPFSERWIIFEEL